MCGYKLNNQVEIIIDSPIISYGQIHELHDFAKLYDIIESVSCKVEIKG